MLLHSVERVTEFFFFFYLSDKSCLFPTKLHKKSSHTLQLRVHLNTFKRFCLTKALIINMSNWLKNIQHNDSSECLFFYRELIIAINAALTEKLQHFSGCRRTDVQCPPVDQCSITSWCTNSPFFNTVQPILTVVFHLMTFR